MSVSWLSRSEWHRMTLVIRMSVYVCVFVLQWYSPKNFQVSYTHPLQAWQKTFKQALFVTEHLADYTKPMYFKYQNIYNDIKEIWKFELV